MTGHQGVGERRVTDMGSDWRKAAKILTEALSATDPTPGGGSAAAVAGAMACALGVMASTINLKSKKLDPGSRPGLEAYAAKAAALRKRFLELADEDAKAFERFMAVLSVTKEDPSRPAKMVAAALAAAEIPLETAVAAADAFRETQAASKLSAGTVSSDLWCCCHLLRAAAHSASENVLVNLKILKVHPKSAQIQRRLTEALAIFA